MELQIPAQTKKCVGTVLFVLLFLVFVLLLPFVGGEGVLDFTVAHWHSLFVGGGVARVEKKLLTGGRLSPHGSAWWLGRASGVSKPPIQTADPQLPRSQLAEKRPRPLVGHLLLGALPRKKLPQRLLPSGGQFLFNGNRKPHT